MTNLINAFFNNKKARPIPIEKKLELISEQKSPLFRLMWTYNYTDTARRQFGNNICAFHIGNGYVLSVAHNIRMDARILATIDDTVYTAEILPYLSRDQITLFNRCYLHDAPTQKRYLNTTNQADIQSVMNTFQQLNFDTRWLNLVNRNFCKIFLIAQFKNDQFYNTPDLNAHFNGNTHFHEPSLNRYTFLLEVELVQAFYNEDIALYKIINSHADVIAHLPCITPDYSVLDDKAETLYCVQSSPNSTLGRLLNKAFIDGFIDHHGIFPDRSGGDYIFEGSRYLIKGYFRFGSSGAPYVFYDAKSDCFKVNAIQSEAGTIQLSINNNKEGNFQYINAIAAPLKNIMDRLPNLLGVQGRQA
jgi:hypothetical protein